MHVSRLIYGIGTVHPAAVVSWLKPNPAQPILYTSELSTPKRKEQAE